MKNLNKFTPTDQLLIRAVVQMQYFKKILQSRPTADSVGSIAEDNEVQMDELTEEVQAGVKFLSKELYDI